MDEIVIRHVTVILSVPYEENALFQEYVFKLVPAKKIRIYHELTSSTFLVG